jgi:hypothetical protein
MISAPIILCGLTEKTQKIRARKEYNMENDALNNILAEGTTAEVENEDQDFDHSYDLSDGDLVEENTNEEFEESEEADDEYDEVEDAQDTPTNRAFAQMRTQNKEFQTKFEELDSLAKSLGMNDVDDLIAAVKETQIQQTAKSQGISVEVARELDEMRALKNSIIAEREERAVAEKEKTFVSNLQEFVDNNNLSNSAVDKLSQDLERDGFTVDELMDMSPNALNRVLNSYVDTSYQKNLERKNNIRRELPINQTSKLDTESLNKEIDQLARQLAGKI